MEGKNAFFPKKQEEAILNVLQHNNYVTVTDLSKILKVSPSTIRLRLRELEKRGLVLRTHGGVLKNTVEPTGTLYNYDNISNYAEKMSIARAAVATLEDNDTIAIGSGTTTLVFARLLRDCINPVNLTVMTNSLYVAIELIARPNTEVRLSGGVVNPSTISCVGSQSEAYFSKAFFSKSYLGVDSVHPEFGFTQTYIGSLMDQALLKCPSLRYMLVDHTKLFKGPFAEHICSLEEVHAMIIDSGADPQMIDTFRTAGLKIIVAQK